MTPNNKPRKSARGDIERSDLNRHAYEQYWQRPDGSVYAVARLHGESIPELKLWYGPVGSCVKHGDARWDAVERMDEVAAFVCASSRADAQRVIESYSGKRPSNHHLDNHWSQYWPSPMKEIVPERGLWILFDHRDNPVKVA